MDIFSVLALLGGLALTLYGMHSLSTGLEQFSGGALERTLENATKSPFRALFLGIGVTALIQSSSATTVMTVGFVNSGIMTLQQSTGTIMGANIGTTVTAWILSLMGIAGDSVVIQLLKPTSFSPILAIVGIGMILFSKRDRRKNIGGILCSFAILMFGMSAMADAVSPLSQLPAFSKIMLTFQNPILGLLAGFLITAVIQSSSAAVGILQALSLTGAITFGAGIPIILGQNIGTCVTALLSCIGASNNAKRTAMIHLYFNIIGSLLVLALFYIANAIFRFSFIDQPLNPAYIAVIHTAFNLIATATLFPFSKGLCDLATLTVRDKHAPGAISRLDERFFSVPSFAVEQSYTVAAEMVAVSRDMIESALTLFSQYDAKKIDLILAAEDRLDHYEDALGTYLVRLSGEKMLPDDSRRVSELLHAIGDLERLGDHAVNLTEVAQEMHDKNLSFSSEAVAELSVFLSAVHRIVTLALDAFSSEDAEKAKLVEPLEEVIDDLRTEIRSRHIERLQSGDCTIQLGFVLSDLLTNLERISDHCSNIAACLIESKHDAFDMHRYLGVVKSPASKIFLQEVGAYAKEYALPPRERTQQEAPNVD